MKQIALGIWVKDKLSFADIKELNTIGQFVVEEKSRLKRFYYWKHVLSILLVKNRIFFWNVFLYSKKAIHHYYPKEKEIEINDSDKTNENIDSICRFIAVRTGKLTNEVAENIDPDEAIVYINELMKLELKKWVTLFNLHKNEKQFAKDIKSELKLLRKSNKSKQIEEKKDNNETPKEEGIIYLLSNTRNAVDGPGCL